MQTAARSTTLYEFSLETVTGEEHLKALAAVLGQFAKAARSDSEASAELADAVTADVFTEIARETDKQLWFVEAHLL